MPKIGPVSRAQFTYRAEITDRSRACARAPLVYFLCWDYPFILSGNLEERGPVTQPEPWIHCALDTLYLWIICHHFVIFVLVLCLLTCAVAALCLAVVFCGVFCSWMSSVCMSVVLVFCLFLVKFFCFTMASVDCVQVPEDVKKATPTFTERMTAYQQQMEGIRFYLSCGKYQPDSSSTLKRTIRNQAKTHILEGKLPFTWLFYLHDYMSVTGVLAQLFVLCEINIPPKFNFVFNHHKLCLTESIFFPKNC